MNYTNQKMREIRIYCEFRYYDRNQCSLETILAMILLRATLTTTSTYLSVKSSSRKQSELGKLLPENLF